MRPATLPRTDKHVTGPSKSIELETLPCQLTWPLGFSPLGLLRASMLKSYVILDELPIATPLP